MSCRQATSMRSCSTSAIRGERLRVETEGVATSAILSASWARATIIHAHQDECNA